MNLKVRGLTGTWPWGGGAVGITMPKFEAKKGDLQKFGKNWGGGGYSSAFPVLIYNNVIILIGVSIFVF